MSVKIIAAVGRNGELGKNGGLCFHIKDDMKFFRETTTGHNVLMGKNTWKSIGRALPNRKNYVATSKPNELPDGIIGTSEPEKLLEKYKNAEEILFAIGGASIYKMALPYADEIIMTGIDASDDKADTFFPEFDKIQFEKTILKEGKEDDLTYSFVLYKRK